MNGYYLSAGLELMWISLSVCELSKSLLHSNEQIAFERENRLRRERGGDNGTHRPHNGIPEHQKLSTGADYYIYRYIYRTFRKIARLRRKQYIYRTVYITLPVNLKKNRLRRKTLYIPNTIYTSQPLYPQVGNQRSK